MNIATDCAFPLLHMNPLFFIDIKGLHNYTNVKACKLSLKLAFTQSLQMFEA